MWSVGVLVWSIVYIWFFFLMIRRPPRSTQSRSSAASDVYKRQVYNAEPWLFGLLTSKIHMNWVYSIGGYLGTSIRSVSYTHLRAHETVLDLVCRLLLEKKKNKSNIHYYNSLLHSPYYNFTSTIT